MPLYEYRCAKCGKDFELLVSGEAKPACPSCGSASIERLLSRFAAVSKEGGSESPSGGEFPCGGDSPSCGKDNPPCMQGPGPGGFNDFD